MCSLALALLVLLLSLTLLTFPPLLPLLMVADDAS